MTEERFSRSEALLGEGATERLRGRHVAVFGLGGVGSYLVEAHSFSLISISLQI